jgi:two-component system cell cycle response regulator DivK
MSQALHALVIDDNSANASIISKMLMREGVTATQVTHPGELPELLTSLSMVDLVFLDLEMPELNGYEVLDMLRATACTAGANYTAYTVYTNEAQNAVQHGFHNFLGKPLDRDRFPDQLARIVNGESVWEFG